MREQEACRVPCLGAFNCDPNDSHAACRARGPEMPHRWSWGASSTWAAKCITVSISSSLRTKLTRSALWMSPLTNCRKMQCNQRSAA